MCGICGIVEKSGNLVDVQVLRQMTHAMIHRGPDDDGYYASPSVGLGFRRLSIVDVNEGHQPLANENETVWAMLNGEIYNYKQLRDDLIHRGHRFATNSDTEVIVHLYEEKGISFVKELRGMFAIAVYDEQTRKLYLARDHFGIKPLYYCDTNDTLVFASEIKSILAHPEVRPAVSMQALWNYMSFQYVPDPDTLFQGISKLPPAHYLVYEDGRTSVHAYWKAEFNPDYTKPLSYFVEGIESHLRDSVYAHLTGDVDVPRGAFLSSGIDSTSIVALMREKQSVQTFSVGFENSLREMNELSFARQIAHQLGTEHHGIEISQKRYQDELQRLIYFQEDPVADPSAIALYFVAEVASSFVKVVLSGEGADEIFGGYPIYHEPRSLQLFEHLPLSLRQGLGKLAHRLPDIKGRNFLQRGSVPVERRFIGNANIFSDDAKREFIRISEMEDNIVNSFYVTDPHYQSTRHLDDITRMQAVDMHTWLPGDILMKADKMSMLNSLEVRVPFLDVELFSFAATIPSKYRVTNGTTKYALRQAVKNIVPDFVYNRPKLGFPVPLRQWLRGDMLGFVRDVIHSSQTDHLIDADYVENLLKLHLEGYDHAREIWTVLNFMLWHQMFIEGKHTYSPSVSSRVNVRNRRMQQHFSSERAVNDQ